MEAVLPEGTPPVVNSGAGNDSDVTFHTPGPLGIVWKQHTASPRGTPRDFAVVKSVKTGSSAAAAGVRPFEVLMSLNGMTVAAMDFATVIEKIRGLRPLRLKFAPLERAWLRTELLFITPGPLGLKLEPATGDPRGHGVRLKQVLPTSVHADRVELTPGMRLVAMRVGLAQPVQLSDRPYGDVVQHLKTATRPLTLFFDPGESGTEMKRLSAETRGTSAGPTWSRTTEEEIRQALQQHGRDASLAPRVCEAFRNARYSPGSWVQELATMHRQNELEAFMSSVSVPAARKANDPRAPPNTLAAKRGSTEPDAGSPVGEFETRAMAAIVAEENFKTLSMLEQHTEEILRRLLAVAQEELVRVRHEAAAKVSANAEALSRWQERAERAEKAEVAAREAASLAMAASGQSNPTLSPPNGHDCALLEKYEALQSQVEFYESRLREKEESHQAELQMRDILLRATELELKKAYSGGACDSDSQVEGHQLNTHETAVSNAKEIVQGLPDLNGPGSIAEAPVWPSFFKLELQRLSEEQRHREAQIRAEVLAQVAEDRAAIDARCANYEDIVERAYAQVLDVFDMPKFDDTRPL